MGGAVSLYGRILEQRRQDFDARVWELHRKNYADEYIARREKCTVDEVMASLRRTRTRLRGTK